MNTLLRRSLTGLVTACLVSGVVAFAPAPTAATVEPTAPEVDAVLQADGSWVRTVDGMTDRLGFAPGDDLRDPLTWFARARRVSAAAGLTTVSALDGVCVDGCAEEEAAEEATYAFDYPIEDLDGDGTGEVLSLEVTFGGEEVASTTTARSGADGSVLWTSTDEGLAFAGTVPDLDGDGLTDLVGGTWDFVGEWSADCATPLGLCSWSDVYTEVLHLTAHRGTDASPLGAYTVEGSYRYEYDDASVGTLVGATGSQELRVTVDDGFFGVGLADLDGDGTPSLLHETFDATFTQRVDGTINDTPFGYADAVVVDTAEQLSGTVDLVDIVAGTRATVISRDDVLPYSMPVPGPQGDQLLVDLFPERGTEREACVVLDPVVGTCRDGLPGAAPNTAVPTRALYDGDLTKVWEVPLADTSWFAYGAGGDVDGDGVDDLFDIGFDPDTWEDTVAAVSGATGATIWTAPASVVALDGDRAVGARLTFWDDVAVDGLVLDAATGTVLAERRLVTQSFEEPGDEDTVTFGSIGLWVIDVTAGSVDVIAESSLSTYTVTEYCDTWEDPDGGAYEECWYEPDELVASESDIVAVDGRDLAELVHLDDPGLYLLDVAEYDDEVAAAELVVMEFDAADWYGFGGPVRALRLDGSTLWEAADPLVAIGSVETPDGTSDVLVGDLAADTISVRDGRDLTPRWTAAR